MPRLNYIITGCSCDTRKAIKDQETFIQYLQEDLRLAKTFCLPQAVGFWGSILEQRWWEENGIIYYEAIDKMTILIKKAKWECQPLKGCINTNRP